MTDRLQDPPGLFPRETALTLPTKYPKVDSKEEKEEGLELEQDVYSMMFVSGIGMAFFFALFVIMMQLFIVTLFYWDLLKDGDSGNKLNVPVYVNTQVRIAQFMALPLTIMSHEDCTTALYQLAVKYDPKILLTYPYATRGSWITSVALRFLVGFLLIYISFIEVMQATRITELFLNLEAIIFVGALDNFGFWLAEKGF